MSIQSLRHKLRLPYRALKHRVGTASLLMLVILSMVLPPGVVQAEAAAVILPPPTFSVQRGLVTNPFQLTLSTLVVGGTIRYTMDGTTPTNNYGTVYSGPINIAATTAVRALVYAGSDTSPVETHTYIFINTVRNQS